MEIEEVNVEVYDIEGQYRVIGGSCGDREYRFGVNCRCSGRGGVLFQNSFHTKAVRCLKFVVVYKSMKTIIFWYFRPL